jgi:hypothetical protein
MGKGGFKETAKTLYKGSKDLYRNPYKKHKNIHGSVTKHRPSDMTSKEIADSF